MSTFNVNTSEIVHLTNRLEKLHKSSMPVVVRQTLNDAAFDMKKKQIRQQFESNFTIRKKTFIRSHTSAVKSPNTFDLRQMVSQAGVIKGKSAAGDRLYLQEFGGRISNRKKIPQPAARIGQNQNKLVAKRRRFSQYKGKKGVIYSSARETILKTKKAVILFRKGAKPTPLYITNISVNIPKSPFMLPASEKTQGKLLRFFKIRAYKKLKL